MCGGGKGQEEEEGSSGEVVLNADE